uniref:Uncharacterized protein n=1 Tax=Anguilla anguilla TaxID=7936 RepID=A0A0E9U8T0_ANGAN
MKTIFGDKTAFHVFNLSTNSIIATQEV